MWESFGHFVGVNGVRWYFWESVNSGILIYKKVNRGMALVGNLVSYLRAKSETKNVTPDTVFRFNSKDAGIRTDLFLRWFCFSVYVALYVQTPFFSPNLFFTRVFSSSYISTSGLILITFSLCKHVPQVHVPLKYIVLCDNNKIYSYTLRKYDFKSHTLNLCLMVYIIFTYVDQRGALNISVYISLQREPPSATHR
jgi:hypothetical protein